MSTVTNDSGQGGVRYPWKRWLRRKNLVLYWGDDFECLPHSMAQQVRNAAYRYGYKVSIQIGEDKLEIRSTKNGE